MADETKSDDSTETSGPDTVVETTFPGTDEFEDGDDLDNDTVEMPEDSFDADSADFDSEGCGCA